MTRRLALLALALLVSTSAFAQAFDRTTYASPSRPGDVFVADFNQDGKPDIVTTQESSNYVTVFLNNGNGTYTGGGSTHWYVGGNASSFFPRRVVAADFDGDGKKDVVAATCNSGAQPDQGGIAALYGFGNGQFVPSTTWVIPGENCPTSLAIIHLPGDSRPDLVITRNVGAGGSAPIVIIKNTGVRNGWQVQGTIIPTDAVSSYGISAADYDKDGVSDIAVINKLSTGHTCTDLYFPNTTKARRRLACPDGAEAVNTVDFKNDGVPDIIIPFSGGLGAAGVIALSNDGAERFTSQQLNLVGSWSKVSWKASEHDFNLDGVDDIVVGTMRNPSDGQDGFAIFLATGVGFWGQTYFGSLNGFDQTPLATATGDFNTDGKGDFALVRYAHDALDVFLNSTSGGTAPCSTTTVGVKICSPAAGSTVSSPVHVSAAAQGNANIVAMKAYLDGVQVASSSSGTLTASANASAGSHTLTVNAWDAKGALYQARSSFSVSGGGTSTCTPPSLGVVICKPAAGSTVASPVAISAAAKGSSTIVAMKAYLDGVQVASSSSGTLSASVNAASGSHGLTVNAWESTGKVHQSKVVFSVAGGSCPAPDTNASISICSPAAGATVTSPVSISTMARWDGHRLTFTRVYIDGTSRCEAPGAGVVCSVALGSGSHTMQVNTWDSAGAVLKAVRSFSVR